jgi:predicted ester cyclase
MPDRASQSPNERTVRAYVEAMNAGDFTGIERLFTPDATIRGVLGWGGIEVALPIWRELHDGMNMRLEIEDLVSSGETVVVRFTETGRFTGPFRGLAGHEPTGKPYEIQAIEWFEMDRGLIRRRWAGRDSAAITRQVLGG